MVRTASKVNKTYQDKKKARLEKEREELEIREREKDPDFYETDEDENEPPSKKLCKRGRPKGSTKKCETRAISIKYFIPPEDLDAHPLKYLNGKIDSCCLDQVVELNQKTIDESDVIIFFILFD